jgi:hypothetical protein
MKTSWRKYQENSSDRISHAWAPLKMPVAQAQKSKTVTWLQKKGKT